MSIKRTNLDWARDVARRYRSVLALVSPEKCAEVDEEARAAGQTWVAPTLLPADAAAELLGSVLAPLDIAAATGVPAATIYGWVSKGLLEPSPVDSDGKPFRPGEPAKYLVSDVMSVQGRRRVRRLDIA